MKNNILKSIFVTILLLLGASHAAWGASYYYRGSKYGWNSATPMTVSADGYYEYCVGTYNGTHSFKICVNANNYDGALNCEYTQSGFNSTDITNMNSKANNWDNNNSKDVRIYNDNNALYHILVYYPNTAINTTDKPIICASTTLPNNASSPMNPCYALHASFLNNWGSPIKFTESADGKTASCTYTVNTTSSSAQAFGIRQLSSCDNIGDQAAWWYATDNTSIAQTSTIQLYKKTTNGCSDPTIVFNAGGEYTFTIEYSTMKLSVTYPSTSYTVTFDMQEHGEAIAAQKVISGEKATEPAAPTAAGFIFGGWYTDSKCTNKYDFANTTVTDNITLYAEWTENKYTVTISAGEGGIVEPSGEQQVGITPVNITATPNEGYEFANWSTEGGATVASSTSSTTTVTATATGTVTANFKASSTSVSYYYHDDKNTKWTGDGNVGTANSTEGYVYWEFSKNQYDDNNFKIFNCKPKPADEQAGQIHPNLIGYDDKIDNTLSNGGLTLTDPSGDNWHNIRLPNTSGAYYIILYLPKSTYNTTSEYKVAIRVTLPGTTAATSYWYFDDKNTGWDNTIADTWKFVDAGNYAYVLVPANNESNKFKVFSCNPKNDSQLVANDGNIATGELAGDIALKNTDTDWRNIVIDAVPSDYYVILYYPNTTINPSNNFLVAASHSLPNAEPYNVTFGVVGNTGGTLTAKSGSSTIESGALVSFATFTATPAAGYSVEGWYADAEGNTKIDAAGTNTTYSQAITKANNTVYVKFAKKYAIYFKPNDIAWENIYAYLFTASPWEDTKGVHPKQNRSEYGQMSKLNDSVYYYNLTQTADITHFAFNNNVGQADYGEFNGCEAVYRSDFHKDMPVFIAQRDPKIEKETNSTKYYNEGVLMKFNDTDPGYELGIRNQSTDEMPYYRFTAEKAGDYISTVNVELTKDVTYSFLVKNDKAYYFTPQSATTCTSSNSHFELFKWDNKIEVVITPAVTGTYTFQLNLANGKVEIDVLYPTTSYRLVYVEKNGSTVEKFHPSHIIKSHPEATAEAPMFDTVSMHVRLKLLQKKAVSGTTDVKYDTVPNDNTCEVWLQEFKVDNGAMDWKTIQTINTKTYLTTNGVYNFIIAQGATTSIDPKTIHPYTGRYYIRTDASDGGWKNYKQLSNYCYYTEYSRVYRGFDYYYCHWAPKANIKYTIACDYSYCVSDTLAKEDHEPHSFYTDANGTLQHNANVRFMWNSFDNTLDRAYIAGAGDNLHLLSASGIYDTKGTENKTVSLLDQENWVYRADVKADTQARIRLRAMPYNGATTYSWFRGKEGKITDKNNTEQLIEGKAGTQYTIRVIYDFKTDHLICAWVPDGNDEISETIVVNADLMLLRENHKDAAQLKFSTNGQLKDITVAYSVINITKAHLSDKDKTTLREKEIYWISFPYDVNLSDVFGCGKYGEHFIIQYYDGAARAEKGCWADSPTFWTYIENPTGVVLKKGLGYVLVLDSKKILEDQFKYNNASVNIYFPSSGPIDSIDAKLPTAVEVPEHKCTIKRDNRDIYDSNWNIIGVPTWANIGDFNNPMTPEQSGDSKVGFYYAHNASTDTWSVCDEDKIKFQSMYSYLVQWAGTINWQETSATGELHPSSLAPRRYAPAAEGEGEATAPEQYTLCLTLNRGGQQLDHTYVRLQEGNVTTDFDLNYDMTKILNSGANLYSLVGTNLIQCAANVQPLQEEARTISIPLGVVADQDGLYTFSLPEGTEGMNVSIADYESGTVHNLALGDYQTALSKGTYEGRFALEIQPRQEVTTGCEQTDAAGKHLRKVLIDGNLYILRDGKAYTAAGQEL